MVLDINIFAFAQIFNIEAARYWAKLVLHEQCYSVFKVEIDVTDTEEEPLGSACSQLYLSILDVIFGYLNKGKKIKNKRETDNI